MKFLRKKWVIGALLAFLAIGLIAVSRQRIASGKTDAAVTTEKAQRTDFVNVISSSGKTSADKSVELKFQTSGRLTWVGVKEGDTVGAWQAIASLDPREVQKNLEKVLIDYSVQRNTFEETRKYDFPADKPQDALNERMKYLLEENQWDLDKAVLDVELKHLGVEYATLTTPIGGIITHIDTPIAGINITPATAVFTVSDPESLLFEATVDETDVAALTVGQKATIMLDAFPDATFSGTVAFIAYTAEQSSGGATVFPVKISFDNPEGVFRIGLNGDVTIETSRQTDVVTVPTEAIREDDQGSYVYRKNGDRYEIVRVQTGAKSEDEIIITDGLSDGDNVVTKGFSSLPK